MTPNVSVHLWVQGLCGGPDEQGGAAVRLRLVWGGTDVHTGGGKWEAVLLQNPRRLIVALPAGSLASGSRDAFIAMLEYAEEKLGCQYVIVLFAADRPDRAALVRTFMFLGLTALRPTSPVLPKGLPPDHVAMLYNISL